MSFASIAIDKYESVKLPVDSDEEYYFEDSGDLEDCIELLLKEANEYEKTEDLERRLNKAGNRITGEFTIEDAREALDTLANNFENFLQVIAIVKYGGESDEIRGNELHKGFLNTSLGGLLCGDPSPRRGTNKNNIPEKSIVEFSFDKNTKKNETYRKARNIRNKVHDAERIRDREVLESVEYLIAAYLFSVLENKNTIVSRLHKKARLAEKFIDDLDTSLPFTIDATLESEASTGYGEEEQSVRFKIDHLEDQIRSEDYTSYGVYGNPGAGKTTLVRELASKLCRQIQKNPLSEERLPVVLQANRYTSNKSFTDFICSKLELHEKELASYADTNPLAIFIDGINEIQRDHIRSGLIEIQNIEQNIPNVVLLVTSRIKELFQGVDFQELRLTPFDRDDIKRYLRKKFDKDSNVESFYNELLEIPRLMELCRNPLLLYMLTDISEETVKVPQNRGKLLDEFMDRFLDRERRLLTPVKPTTVRRVLSKLAYHMQNVDSVALPQVEVESKVENIVSRLHKDLGSYDVIDKLIESNLLTDVGEEKIGFFHELVQEYFAALELKNKYIKGEADLRQYILDKEWEEVIVLFYGILGEEKEEVFRKIRQYNIALLARCVMDSPIPDESQETEVVEEAEETLNHQETSRSQAIRALAEVWNESAVEQIAESLKSSQQVADFVLRLKEDPYSTAADLIRVSPEIEVLQGLERALRAAPDDLRSQQEMARSIINLIQQYANDDVKGHTDLYHLGRLSEFAELPTDLELQALRAISKVLDRNIVNAADRLFAGFGLTGKQYSLEEQILVATIEDGMDPSSCATLNPDGLSEDTRRSLFMSALVETEPDWIQLLSGTDMDSEWIQAAQSAIARKMFEKGETGERVYETLRAMSGDDDARNKLGEMLLAGEVPATEAYTVARDTSNADALARTANEYIRKATWETNRPEVYVGISLLADSGVVDESVVSNEIKRSKLSDSKEKLLSLIYLCGAFDSYLNEIKRAKKDIQAGDFRLESAECQWLYCNAFWEFWEVTTEKHIIEYSLKIGPNKLNSNFWSNNSLQKAGNLFLNRLKKGELQFRREVFRFADVEEEATDIIMMAINNLIECRREKRASSLICVWEIGKSHIDNASRQLEIEISNRIRESALKGNIDTARSISDKWDMGGIKETIKGSQTKMDPIVMAKGYENEIFDKEDVEEWFSKEVEEDLNNALGILRADVKSDLRNVATVKVLEAIESSEYLKAGRLISAFGLQSEFGPEITKILPALVESRKTGIIKNLLAGVGKSVASSFSDLIFDKCKEYVDDGNPKDAMIIVEKSGVSYMAEEFYEWLSNKVKEATVNVDYDFLLSILDERRSWEKLDTEVLVQASSIVNYEVELKVLKVLREDGYAFANLPEKAGRVFVHASNLDTEFYTLERGEYIYATVELGDEGPKAVQASRTPQQSEALHRL